MQACKGRVPHGSIGPGIIGYTCMTHCIYIDKESKPMRRMYRKVTAGVIAAAMLMGMSGCGSSKPTETAAAATKAETTAAATEAATTEAATEAAQAGGEKTEIQVFIAASLNTVMQDLAKQYNEQHPEVTITFNADSSGKLLTQIEEGYACDVFFSASQKQMNTLDEEDKLVVEGTRKNVVNNQVCVITTKDSGTKVTGLQKQKKIDLTLNLKFFRAKN